MSERKIIQIIPAPKDLRTMYDDDSKLFKSRVVCLALVEEDGERTVEAMDLSDNEIDLGCNVDNYLGIEFEDLITGEELLMNKYKLKGVKK